MTEAGLLTHQTRPARAAPEGLLVLLHGRGSDEFDLLPVADAIDPERRLLAITPRGPLALPPGGAHWYAVARVGFPDPATFWDSHDRLATWLDALPAQFGVPYERTVLGGFSQGAVMSYALALGRGRPAPAGLIALSGFMPTVERFELDLTGREGFRAALGHGTLDPVISVEFARSAHARLERAGVSVLYRESSMAHSIDPRFMSDLQGWLIGV